MTDLEAAILVIKVAASADHGCPYCTERTLRHAVKLRPDLPWKIAAEGLRSSDEDTYEFTIESLSVEQ